jgi:ferric-dicitrate binding protein FerR (iron transport regulator)
MDNQALHKIIARKWLNNLSSKERGILEEWLTQSPQNRELYDKLTYFFENEGSQAADKSQHEIQDLINVFWEKEKLKSESRSNGSAKVLRLKFYSAAAVIILLFSLPAIYFLNHISHRSAAQNVASRLKDSSAAAPGTNKAILVLSNGEQIDLAHKGNAVLKESDGTTIDYANGQLKYSGNEKPGTVLLNTLNIPRGGKYQLELQDGTTVYLNAASSLRFPTNFSEKQRIVYVTGEAFFKVKPKYRNGVKIPFIVDVAGREQVEVVGTQFNVHSYDDEKGDRTTLVEGLVNISGRGEELHLKPGEQALSKGDAKMQLIEHADIDKTVAWKNDLFQFRNDNLEIIMKQISRWYDVDVQYKHLDETVTYSGTISRNAPLANVLEMLKLSGVEFDLKGKNLTVLKNIKQGN